MINHTKLKEPREFNNFEEFFHRYSHSSEWLRGRDLDSLIRKQFNRSTVNEIYQSLKRSVKNAEDAASFRESHNKVVETGALRATLDHYLEENERLKKRIAHLEREFELPSSLISNNE
jgi:hypothetical protein